MLLSVETSSSYGGLSIFDNKNLLAEKHWGLDQSHSETLTDEFQKLLQKLNLSPSVITEVLCSYGPGSFTGLRVGLNFAKSICYVNKIKLTLTPSFRSYLDIKTLQDNSKVKTLVLLNAFKNQVFCCEYSFQDSSIFESMSLTTLTPEGVAEKYSQEKQIVALGDGFHVYAESFGEAFNSKLVLADSSTGNPSVRAARILFEYDHCLKFEKIDPLLAEPLYIKMSEAEENLNRGQIKRHTQRKL